MERQVDTIRELFRRRFDIAPRIFRAPGRINLIGEHTDYNDGFVLPAAIDLQTVVACSPRNDRRLYVWAVDVMENAAFSLDDPAPPPSASWRSYVEGTLRTIDSLARLEKGANIILSSNVPIGAGMSSSAALEVSIGFAIASVNGLKLGELELAKAGQSAEHNFVGTRSGLMDQYASVFGKQGRALLLDCRSLTSTEIVLDHSEFDIAVCDSGVSHELASSEYNRRRDECEASVDVLRTKYPNIVNLRDVTLTDLDAASGMLSDIQRRRAAHVISENARTISGAEALQQGDLRRFGELMFGSHESLRSDFEVSCRELDVLVESARKVEGVFGSRMMGGGFGGSTISILEKGAISDFRDSVASHYQKLFGREPNIYEVRSANGVSEIA